MKTNEHLIKLDIEGNKINEGAIAIAEALITESESESESDTSKTRLQQLSINNNKITANTMIQIVDALKRNKTLTHVDLGNNLGKQNEEIKTIINKEIIELKQKRNTINHENQIEIVW